MNTIQIAIVKRNGRDKALWQAWLDNANRWEDHWHSMTMAEARQALRTGKIEMGYMGLCRVKTHNA